MSRGCCWEEDKEAPIPCYYSAGYGYAVESLNATKLGYSARLKRKADKQPSLFGHDIEVLQVDVLFESSQRLHVKV